MAADPHGGAVQASHVTKVFTSSAETVRAVDDASFNLGHGEFACLHGASGSGKSTLLRILAGLTVPDSGTARVAGRELSGLDEKQRARLRLTAVGVVFQDANLIDEFNAWENVALPLEAQGLAGSSARSSALEALERVGMADLAHRRPKELSGGQRQRVGIARAIVGDRSVLLADEPTGALDSRSSAALYELLAKLSAGGTTVLVVSHDPECRAYAGHSWEMVDGRLLTAAGQ